MHFNRKKITQSKLVISSKGRTKKKSSKVVEKKDIIPVVKLKQKNKKSIRMVSKSAANNNIVEYRSLSNWFNILSGHTAFILGNFPSISNYKLKLLDSYFTIGINRIFYLYDPTILMWQDRELWNSDKKMIVKQKAIKMCSYSADPRNSFINFKVELGGFKFTNDPSRLFGRGNTTVLAAEMAIALGCSNLVLLGTDCKYGENGKTDFYGKNKDHKPYTLKMCSSAMEWLKINCPVPIYNCSDNILWENQKLEDVIKIVKPKSMGREEYKNILSKL